MSTHLTNDRKHGGGVNMQSHLHTSPFRLRTVCAGASWLCMLSACGRPTASSAAPPARDAEAQRRVRLSLAEIQPLPRFPQPESPDAPTPRGEIDRRAARYLEKGERRFKERLWADAISSLERAIQFEPRLADAHLLLARAALQHGDDGLADRHARIVIQREPRNVSAHQILGEIAWRRGRSEEAVAALRLALMASTETPAPPEAVLARLTLAFALHKEGYLTAAAEQLEVYLAATERPTPQMTAHLETQEAAQLFRGKAEALLGTICVELGEHEQAAGAFQRAIARRPDDAGLRRMHAEALEDSGSLDGALTAVRRWILDFPQQAEAFELLRTLCGRSDSRRSFAEELNKLAAETTDASLRGPIASELVALGREADAIAVIEPALSDEDASAQARYLLARLYAEAARVDDAYALILATLNRSPESAGEAEAVLAGKPEGAGLARFSAAARRLVREQPKDAAAHLCIGLISEAEGRSDDALVEFETAFQLDNRFAFALTAAARVRHRQKQWEDVVGAADGAIERGIHTAEIYFLKGSAHDALNETKEAEEAFVEAFQRDRKNPEPLFRLARSAQRQGDLRRSRQLYRKILDDVDPRFAKAREALIMLFLNQGEYERAKDYLSDFAELGQDGPAAARCRAMLELPDEAEKTPQERLDGYLSALNRILDDHPDDAATHLEIATTYQRIQQHRQALPHAERALALDPDNIEALELMANLQRYELRFDKARDAFVRLVENRPRDGSFLKQWRESALDCGDDATAIEAQKRLLGHPEFSKDREVRAALMNQLIALLEEAGQTDEAIRAAEEWRDEAPDDAMRRRRHIELLSRAGRHDEAITLARRELEASPQDVDAQLGLLARLQTAGRYGEARLAALDFLTNAPDDVNLNRALILLCVSAEDWDSAIDLALTGASHPDQRSVYEALLVQNYVLARRYDEAVEFLRDKIGQLERARREAADPSQELITLVDLDDAQEGLINVLIHAERFGEAEGLTNQLLRPQVAAMAAGGDVDTGAIISLRSFLIRIYQDTGRRSQAMQQMEAIYELLTAQGHRPDTGRARQQPGSRVFVGMCNDLGYTWADAGKNLDRAEELVRFAVFHEPRLPAYLDSLGWVFYKQGKMEEAVQYLQLTQEFSTGDDPIIFDHLADALYRLGRAKEAGEYWEKAMALCDASRDPPPDRERRELHGAVKKKLRQLSEGKPVDTAEVIGTAKETGAAPG